MLFLIFVFMFVISLIIYKLDKNKLFKEEATFLRSIGFSATIISLTIIFMFHIRGTSNYAEKVERYNKITYKIENEICQDTVLNEIERWNKDIRVGKARQRDFWVGIFYPNIYDEFELIDYSSYRPN